MHYIVVLLRATALRGVSTVYKAPAVLENINGRTKCVLKSYIGKLVGKHVIRCLEQYGVVYH